MNYLPAVVCSAENFKNYVCGVNFGVASDHKPLQSVLKTNKGNMTFPSRLTQCLAESGLPFDCNIVHTPGTRLGSAGHLLGHPSEYEATTVKSKKLFNSWFTNNVVNHVAPTMHRNWPMRMNQSETRERKKLSKRQKRAFLQSTRQCSSADRSQSRHLKQLIFSNQLTNNFIMSTNEFCQIQRLVVFM